MVTLVESLIGKGCQVRILDAHVSLARLVGANRRYIEEQIPHIASLMCEDAGALLDHAEVVVLGNGGPQAADVLSACGPQHLVVDLTRGRVRERAANDAAVALAARIAAITSSGAADSVAPAPSPEPAA
jgi:GDP-mannose 6-dehydrogenase